MATKAATATTTRGAALLRGINVGGNNKVPMDDLKKMFVAAGCNDVVSYINSGNIVFTAPLALWLSLSKTIQAAIERKLELQVPVVLRTADELRRALADNPFADGRDEKGLYVMFLSTRPTAAQVAGLDAKRSPGDEFRVIGGEIFLALQSAADTRLTNVWIDKQLATTSTSRNLNTLRKLIELSST